MLYNPMALMHNRDIQTNYGSKQKANLVCAITLKGKQAN